MKESVSLERRYARSKSVSEVSSAKRRSKSASANSVSSPVSPLPKRKSCAAVEKAGRNKTSASRMQTNNRIPIFIGFVLPLSSKIYSLFYHNNGKKSRKNCPEKAGSKKGTPGGRSFFLFAKRNYAGITLTARSFALFLGSGSVSNVTF